MKQKTVAIINFNTPELTEACILSIRKHGCYWPVVVFDNSQSVVFPPGDGMKERTIEARPFTKKMNGVAVVDNTKGQVIDFEKELTKFPEKHIPHGGVNNWGSDLHMMTVERLWELLPDGFILVESDVLVRTDIRSLWREEYSFCAYVQKHQQGNRFGRGRILPMLCYFNVPRFREEGVHYFDPNRSWMLHHGEENPLNWYDTGASLLEDVLAHRPRLKGLHVDIRPMIEHLGGGSYYENENDRREKWLKRHEHLWNYKAPENKDAKIYVCTHTDFTQAVNNPVYEVVDVRKDKKSVKAPRAFYSELLHMKRVSEKKKLTEYVGFCQYRKYFDFMDVVPDIAATIEKHGAITTTPLDMQTTMRDQFASWGNVADLDIVTDIINTKHPSFADAWKKALESHYLHLGTMYIVRRDEFKELVALMWAVVNEFLKVIGGNIEKHIAKCPVELLEPGDYIRVGGSIAERIASAWMDWKHPHATRYGLTITGEKAALDVQ